MIERKKPLISVIIPTYARNDTLKNAIDSILRQTYPNIEIIVVDDNPSDSKYRRMTEQIVKEYQGNKQFSYIQNKTNLGGAEARNEGIKVSKGEYIAFLDDDDEYFPKKLEKQLELFLTSNNEKLALVFCDAVMTLGREQFVCNVTPRYSGCCIYESMRDNCLAATSQWLVRKDVLEEVGMFTDVPCKQDSQVILKILTAGYEVAGVPEILSKYCNYDGIRISGKGEKNLKGELLYREACRKQYYRFTFQEIQEVEYTFAKKLYVIYRNMGRRENWKNEWNTMKRVHRFSSWKFLLKQFYYRLKDKARK